MIAYYGHISSHTVPHDDGSELIVNTHAIIVRNSGGLSAKGVRVGHQPLKNYTYTCDVWPSTKYEESSLPDGVKEICFQSLVPNEQVTISYLYFSPITVDKINSYVKSDEGFAKIINVIPAPNLPTWKKALFYILLFIGCWSVIYIAIILLVSIFKCFSSI